ncbi:MAG TPA: MFS transporter [Roseiflexaceae bacterium]|nr:MFS transporter [Roseiflexaceae bacterium]
MDGSLTDVASSRPAPAWRPRIVITLLIGYFVLFGITIGAQGVLWAEIMTALRLSEGALGSAQLASPLVSVGFLLGGGMLISFMGKKRLAIIGLLVLGLSSIALAAAGNVWGLVGALLIAGAGFGAVEMVMNSATLDWEHATGKAVMNGMHAGFSGGAVVGALLAGLLLDRGWGYTDILWLLAFLAVAVLLVTLPTRYPPSAGDDMASESASPLAALRLLSIPAILLLAIIGLLGVVGESVALSWSVIYLRQLGADVLIGGAAFALFNGMMFIARLLNAPLMARFGVRTSLLISGACVVVAGGMLMLPGQVWLATLAFALCGLGVAGVIPTVLSAAARIVPGSTGAVTGAIMAVAYFCFIVTPPLTGWIAEAFTLQAALLSVGLSGAAILLLASRVGSR